MLLTEAMQKITARQDLSAAETQSIFDQIFTGGVSEEHLATLLQGLHDKGETVDELLGAARSMRQQMLPFAAGADAIDIVGTGGDNHGTLNVSTAAVFVVAACGVPVAKHGNRASTSRSGSSDTLKQLGVNLEPAWALLEKSFTEIGIVFLFAPRHHPAMRHVIDVRRKLKIRTIFNRLGPLTNPANVHYHMMGVYDLEGLGPMAEVLRALGSERAWLVHGHDGLDEISTTTATDVVELNHGQLQHFTLTPEQVGLTRVSLVDLKGSDAVVNANAIQELFAGKKSAYRDIVVFNAAAALIVAGKTNNLSEGIKMASAAIESGIAKQKLEALIRITNEPAT